MLWARELLTNESFWALVGVFLGFILGEVSRVIRERRELQDLKSGLWDELEANRWQIAQKRDIVRQMIDALASGHLLPGSSVPPITGIFDNHFGSVVKALKPIERDNVHHIYSLLKKNDAFLDSFEHSFKADVEGPIKDPFAAYSTRLQEIDQSYGVTEVLIGDLLRGQPRDIYYRRSGHQAPPKHFAGMIRPDVLSKTE